VQKGLLYGSQRFDVWRNYHFVDVAVVIFRIGGIISRPRCRIGLATLSRRISATTSSQLCMRSVMRPWQVVMSFFNLVLRKGDVSRFALSKKYSWVWRNDDLFFGNFDILFPWLCLAFRNKLVPFLPVVSLPEVDSKANEPCYKYDASADTTSNNRRFGFLSIDMCSALVP